MFYINTFIQVTFGILQLYHYVPSNHNAFLVTGGFFNPAPYAIYLSSLVAFLVPILLYFIKKQEKLLSVLTLILLLSCILLIAICYSRSAWIGLFFSLLFIVAYLLGSRLFNLWKYLKYKVVWISTLLTLSFSIAFWLYSIKENSALGRLLIWKVSFTIFQENPISGIGAGAFGANYVNFQYNLFQNSAVLSLYKGLAGDVRFAFNDFLQILCENGIIGLLLFCSVVVFTFYKKSNLSEDEFNLSNIIDLSLLSSVIVLLISGMSSYPLSLLSLQVVFWISIACLSSLKKRRCYTLLVPSSSVKFVCVALVFLASFFIFYAVRRWRGFLKLSEIENRSNAVTGSDKLWSLYPILADHPSYLSALAKKLKDEKTYIDAINILQNAKQISPEKEIYFALGDIYSSLKQYDDAEKEYMFVSIAIPSLLKPKYLLAKMYYNSNQHQKFLETAHKILSTPLKIETYETFFMKEEIRSLINTKSHSY